MFLPNRTCLICLVAAGVLSAGCSEHWDSRDPLTRGAGDAIARNKVVHTIDPWPRVASQKRVPTDGERGALGNERYRKNQSIDPQSGTLNGPSREGSGL